MKLILPLFLLLISNASHAKVEIQTYKKNHSWNNSWNDSIASELDQNEELMIMNGKIDLGDLKELNCPGYNNLTNNDLKKDFWVVFFSALTRAESAFNTKARSHSNHGLLQLAKATARTQCGRSTLEESIDAGEHLLPRLIHCDQVGSGLDLSKQGEFFGPGDIDFFSFQRDHVAVSTERAVGQQAAHMLNPDPRTVGVLAVGLGGIDQPLAFDLAAISGGALNGDAEKLGALFFGWVVGFAGHA